MELTISILPRRARWAAAAGLLLALAAATGLSATPSRAGADAAYVVRVQSGGLPAVEAAVRRADGTVLRSLAALDTATVRLPVTAVAGLRGMSGVLAVTPDVRVRLSSTATGSVPGSYNATEDPYSLFSAESVIGARQIWGQSTGAGIDVAVIDSGVSPVAGLDSTGKIINGPDLSFDSQSDTTRYVDRFGHGTHMAGIIAGHDAGIDASGATGNSTAFLGVAPDARLVSVKVADGRGVADVSQIIAAVDWVVQHAQDPGLNIRVLNLSFGTDSAQDYAVDPLAYAAEVAWRHGIVVVTAAGNSGSQALRLSSPATDPYLIAVGAQDGMQTSTRRDDVVTNFSSRGDGVRNPDLVAPGVHVQGLRVPGSYIDQTYGSTAAINDRYFRGSGTSQATAMTAGAAALVLQHFPSSTPDQVKALLTQTAFALSGTDARAEGAGLLNLRSVFSRALPIVSQSHIASTGTGSLDLARGSAHVSMGGIPLVGEQDIFGNAFVSNGMASLEASATSWSGGTWNSARWTGDSWASSSWASSSWASSSWASSSWASSSWASSSWASSSWASSSWASSSWE